MSRSKRRNAGGSDRTAPVQFVELNEQTQKLRPHSDLLRLLQDRKISEVQSRLGALKQEMQSFDPIHLLGVTGLYVLIWALGASLEASPEYELEPSDLEFLAGRSFELDRILIHESARA